MSKITKEEVKTLRNAVNYYTKDLITEKDSHYYGKVIQSNVLSIRKEEDKYLVSKKYNLIEKDEKRDFYLLGKLSDTEVSINIDEVIIQGDFNYKRIRQGKYSIEDNTIRKEYSQLYYLYVNDTVVPIHDEQWTEEETFISGEHNLITNYQNIEPVEKKAKIKSLRKI